MLSGLSAFGVLDADLSLCLQARRRMGQDCGVAVRDRRCAHNRPSSACHRLQLQLLLPSGNRSGGDAESELQPCHQLSVSSWDLRYALEVSMNFELFS